jgi:hypothetical protein
MDLEAGDEEEATAWLRKRGDKNVSTSTKSGKNMQNFFCHNEVRKRGDKQDLRDRKKTMARRKERGWWFKCKQDKFTFVWRIRILDIKGLECISKNIKQLSHL